MIDIQSRISPINGYKSIYIYIYGGDSDDGTLASVERYSIVGYAWEDLSDMAAARCGHCAVAALRNEI